MTECTICHQQSFVTNICNQYRFDCNLDFLPFCNANIFRNLSRASSSFIFVTRKNLFRYWSSRRSSNTVLNQSESLILLLRFDIFCIKSSDSLSSTFAFWRSNLQGFINWWPKATPCSYLIIIYYKQFENPPRWNHKSTWIYSFQSTGVFETWILFLFDVPFYLCSHILQVNIDFMSLLRWMVCDIRRIVFARFINDTCHWMLEKIDDTKTVR